MAEALGSLLKRYRAAAGLTQEELAEKAAVSARTVSDVERGLRRRIYRDTAGRLAEALGLEPGARSGFETAARGRGADRRISALPMSPTRLIGREQELDVVVALLDRPDVRLVTITGPGGIGKTRVALEAASSARFAGGVFFVQLGSTFDPKQVIPSIAPAVGVSGAKEPTVGAIAERLGDARVLLVLDTFEHVLDAARDVAALLGVCPGTTVLATSREALRIRGEHGIALPTLEIPATPTLDAVLGAPAAALFVERALAVRPQLIIDEGAAGVIAEICQRVNGVPLAIELAAARAKHLPLEQLRDQLRHRLSVLTGGPRDLPRRQQTMRDTVGWSYDLLDEGEQELFRDLCVFSGGWTLDAAAVVCARDVLTGVSALVDKSLVVRAEEEQPRYGMLDVVREYGAELGPGADAEDRHLAYFLALAEEAEPEIGRSSQREWLQRLQHEHDNIRAALHRAVQRGDGNSALRIAGAIWRFWLLDGYLSEGRQWIREGLAVEPDAAPRWRAKGLWGAAWLAYHQGDYVEAERCGEEMVQIAAPRGDRVEIRNALTIRGIVDMAYERFADAVAVFDQCVELLRDRTPDWLLATSLENLGQATTQAGEARALSVLAEAHDLYVALGDEHFAARALVYSGYAALRDGRADASSFFRRSLITFWELDDMWGTTEALEGCAALIGAEGMAEQAATIAGAAEALRETINSRQFPAEAAVMRRHLEAAKGTTSETTWREAWEKGRTMTVEEAVDYALRSI